MKRFLYLVEIPEEDFAEAERHAFENTAGNVGVMEGFEMDVAMKLQAQISPRATFKFLDRLNLVLNAKQLYRFIDLCKRHSREGPVCVMELWEEVFGKSQEKKTMKRKYALLDRDRECTEHSFRWDGDISCTGNYRCYLCGYVEEEKGESDGSKKQSRSVQSSDY